VCVCLGASALWPSASLLFAWLYGRDIGAHAVLRTAYTLRATHLGDSCSNTCLRALERTNSLFGAHPLRVQTLGGSQTHPSSIECR
jgi:hypothetical protein